MRFFPRYSFLRFLPSVAVFLFSAAVGVSFAAWLDAPNAPPNYGIVGCTPPCSQDDFKPMNLGTTPQTKRSGATFEGDLTANRFSDRDDPTYSYFIDPYAATVAGNLRGSFTVGGNVGIGTTDTATYALNVNGAMAADKFFDRNDPTSTYFIDPYSATVAGNLRGSLAVGANVDIAGIASIAGNVGIRTTDTSTYALNVAGNANATQLCIAGDCKSTWPTTPAETDPKVSGGSTNYLTKWTGATALGTSVIYDNGTRVGIGITPNGNSKLSVGGGSSGSIGVYSTDTYGFYTPNTVRAGKLCLGSDSECMSGLVPRATPNIGGGWKWTTVVSNNYMNGGGNPPVYLNSVALDATKVVLGIRLSGNSDDGGICTAGFYGYFHGAVTNRGFITALELDGYVSAYAVDINAGSMSTSEFIFENYPAARNLGGQGYDDNWAYIKAAGVTFIPPGKTLFYKQWYNDGGGGFGAFCQVDVLYADY